MKSELLKITLSIYFTFLLLAPQDTYSQIRLHTEDLPRFYQALDSVMTTTDTIKQASFVQKLYVDKASKGLVEFMQLRGGNTQEWLKFMTNSRSTLLEKRPYILSAINQESRISKKIKKFKIIYPDFRDGDIYFCVGINNSGGTIRDNTVYIGTEISANQSGDWAVPLVLHEFVHTQQWTQRNIKELIKDEQAAKVYMDSHKSLLGQCLGEGMADFVSELVLGQRLAERFPDGHTAFGEKYERDVWKAFQKDMYQDMGNTQGWLYAEKEISGKSCRDLGYYVGYKICKSYYDQARDKKQALAYMIGVNLTDENSKEFLLFSRYNPAKMGGVE
ncbi:gliding motility protein GldB-related protein [Dyadobacter frigoris]|uniref:DUF2268 domain-containing protein n=1 Tax=Dyadobacter frigoris TaxID=2576211 RepID=A0A4U6CPE2_9BACT|nr:DUF2268 domain-containing putative Zn-dependent protease [Dyadobacter frigoris]TKT85996.1 hypothetical protein FDK13_32885 [Dyadobacter frigoris]